MDELSKEYLENDDTKIEGILLLVSNYSNNNMIYYSLFRVHR